MSYDLQNLQRWEHVMIDSLASPLDELEAEDVDDPDTAAAARAAAESNQREREAAAAAAATEEGREPKVLVEMPPSWVQRLHVSRERFEARCPGSTKAITYRKGRLQTFAPYSRADGLVQQLTVFGDPARLSVLEVRQTFALRKDKLATRTRYLFEGKTHEIYDAGRLQGEREHIWIEGVRFRCRCTHTHARARARYTPRALQCARACTQTHTIARCGASCISCRARGLTG